MFKTFTQTALLAITAQAIKVTEDEVECPRNMRGTDYKVMDAADKFYCLVNELEADTEGLTDYYWDTMDDLFYQDSDKSACASGD